MVEIKDYVHQKIQMSITVQSIIATDWKQATCPSPVGYILKAAGHLYSGILHGNEKGRGSYPEERAYISQT